MAAVGSALAARLHDLPVLFPDIQDVTPNVTRFLVLASSATQPPGPCGDDKTSLLFVCEDRPGALAAALDAFSRRSINLTHIEKRPCAPQALAALEAVSDYSRGVARAAAKGNLSRRGSGGGASGAGSEGGGGTSGAQAGEGGAGTPMAAAAAAAAATGSSRAATNGQGVSPAPTMPQAAQAATSGNRATTTLAAGTPAPTAAGLAAAPSLFVPSLLGGRGGNTAPFTYAFFVEAQGSTADQGMADAVAEAARHCVCVKVLGSFPRARRVL
jgi:hypothetical protein